MAVTTRTLRLVGALRIEIGLGVDETTRALAKEWARAWNELAAQWQAASAELVDMAEDGRWPTRSQIAKAARTKRALEATREALNDLGEHAGITIRDGLGPIVEATATGQAAIIASELPTSFSAGVDFDRVDARSLDAIVRRSTGRVTSRSRKIPARTEARIKSKLIAGVAVGKNPTTVAREIAARRLSDSIEDRFAFGYHRAEVIARTEMLDAYRAGALAQEKANSDVLAGWVWSCAQDLRTCPSCWSMDGQQFDVEVPGPIDHQCGRCCRVPVTKPWRDLGIELEERPSVMPNAREVFDGLPRADQLAIMRSPQRLELLQSGAVQWEDLSTLRHTDGWRDSRVMTPLKDLVAA